MRVRWATLNARSRGLACHLLPREALTGLSTSTEIERIAAGLAAHGYEPLWPNASSLAEALDAAANARLAMRIAKLWRWADGAADALQTLFGEETRATLRALVRGCSASVAPAARRAAAVATPELNDAGVARLASARTLRELTALVAELTPDWLHALAPALNAVKPDLFEVELRLSAALAWRARDGGRRGDVGLRGFFADRIDYENAVTALLLATSPARDVDAAVCFIDGGRRLSLSLYQRAAAAPPERSRDVLIRALENGPVGKALETAPALESMRERFLLACIAEQTARAHLDPLSSAPTLSFVLRARWEALRVRQIVWHAVLGAGGAARFDAGARR